MGRLLLLNSTEPGRKVNDRQWALQITGWNDTGKHGLEERKEKMRLFSRSIIVLDSRSTIGCYWWSSVSNRHPPKQNYRPLWRSTPFVVVFRPVFVRRWSKERRVDSCLESGVGPRSNRESKDCSCPSRSDPAWRTFSYTHRTDWSKELFLT